MSDKFDLIIIGAGPGGYVAAIRAAQLGLKTALVEKEKTLGGTCLNIGCIPSKALLHSSHEFYFLKKDGARHGIKFTGLEADIPTMQTRKDKVVAGLVGGVDFLVKKNGVERVSGTGKITAPGKVSVTGADGIVRELEAAHILIATGSVPVELKHLPFDGTTVVDSTGALAFAEAPKRLLVIGAGAIGLELGSVWNRLGSEVTVVEFLPSIGGSSDRETAKALQQALTKEGMKFHLETQVTALSVADGVVTATAKKGGAELTFTAEKVLVSVGRRPYLDGLCDAALGLKLTERGRVEVDAHFRTSVPGIYAIGDAIPGPMLAHKAEEEGVACVEMIAGKPGHVNYAVIPGIIYTNPEVASVGLTEEEAKEKGVAVNIGKFPFRANGRALASDMAEGFVKIIADAKTDRILGAHILAPNAGDLISEVVVCMEFHGSAEDLARTVHAHPTMSEAVKEAALATGKRAIHAIN